MKRDMDFIRNLLLQIEGGKDQFDLLSPEEAESLGVTQEQDFPSREEVEKLRVHLTLLEEAGLIRDLTPTSGGAVYANGLTWSGYDFLDSVRNPEIWSKTQEATAKVGSLTFSILKDVAVAYAKAKIIESTGIPF